MSLVFSGAVITTALTFLLEGKMAGGVEIGLIGLAWPIIVEWSKNAVKTKTMGVEEAYIWGLQYLITYDKIATAVACGIAIYRVLEFINN